MEELLGAPGPRRQHDLSRDDGLLTPPEPGTTASCRDREAAVRQLAHLGDGAQRLDDRPAALGQGEVVLHEGVLRADAAADHAVPTERAACALGALPAEERISDPLPRFPEPHADGCAAERRAHPEVLGGSGHDPLDRSVVRIAVHHAEHAPGCGIVRGERGAPVPDRCPLRVGEERRARFVQRVGVVERPPAHSRTGEDHDVRKPMDALHPEAPERRDPEVATHVPAGLREVLVGESPPGLEHADAVALLREPEGRDGAAEARTDDDDVLIEHARPSAPPGS